MHRKNDETPQSNESPKHSKLSKENKEHINSHPRIMRCRARLPSPSPFTSTAQHKSKRVPQRRGRNILCLCLARLCTTNHKLKKKALTTTKRPPLLSNSPLLSSLSLSQKKTPNTSYIYNARRPPTTAMPTTKMLETLRLPAASFLVSLLPVLSVWPLVEPEGLSWTLSLWAWQKTSPLTTWESWSLLKSLQEKLPEVWALNVPWTSAREGKAALGKRC